MSLPASRSVWRVQADVPAVVLGSSQPAQDIDRDLASGQGIQVVRRRSGGGAVWVSGASLWIDLVIPVGDPLWDDDVPRSMIWLGEVFARVIGGDARVSTSPYEGTQAARAFCFAGLAPGEVVGDRGKIVGISQRRTRDAARFQCVAYTSHDAGAVGGLFSDPDLARQVAAVAVQTVDMDPVAFFDAFVAALPD